MNQVTNALNEDPDWTNTAPSEEVSLDITFPSTLKNSIDESGKRTRRSTDFSLLKIFFFI